MTVDVRIIPESKSAMQSGRARMGRWIIQPVVKNPQHREPVCGWVAGDAMERQLRLTFPTKEAAIRHAERAGWSYEVVAPQQRTVAPKSYADNFLLLHQ